MRNYVYSHIRKDNKQCFYLGKGSWRNYGAERYNEDWCRPPAWKAIVEEAGGYETLILVNNVSKDTAYKLEAAFIKQIGLDTLTNKVPGGAIGTRYVQYSQVWKKVYVYSLSGDLLHTYKSVKDAKVQVPSIARLLKYNIPFKGKIYSYK